MSAIEPNDPRHGRTKGFHAGCREGCCRSAIARYEKATKYRRHAGIAWAIPAIGTQRRIQALMRLGWTSTDIANRCGLSNRNGVLRVLHGQKGKPCQWVERKTYRRFAEVYEQLSMTIPEHTSARARTRSLAASKGYAPPLAWDNIDDPIERPKMLMGQRDRDIQCGTRRGYERHLRADEPTCDKCRKYLREARRAERNRTDRRVA